MFKMLWRLAILILLLYMVATKPYLYQAQLLKSGRPDSPKYVVLLSDRHACPRSDWAVAMDQSEALLSAACRLKGYIVVEDAASAVVPLSVDRQLVFAQTFQASSDLDLCCAAISVTTEPRLRKLLVSLYGSRISASQAANIIETIAADTQTRSCRPRVISQLQENCLLFLALRSARRGIGVENVECRHPEVDRTTWTGLKKLLALLDKNLQQLALFKEAPLVGFSYKHLEALGYRTRVLSPVANYVRNIHVVADRRTEIMELLRMEDQALCGVRSFKDVVRTTLGFFRDYNCIYTPIVAEVARLPLSEFYRGAQDLIFSIVGAPIIDIKILKALYEHRYAPVVIVCAGGYHIESIRPCLEQFGYTSIIRAGSHDAHLACPPVNVKLFFDLLHIS